MSMLATADACLAEFVDGSKEDFQREVKILTRRKRVLEVVIGTGDVEADRKMLTSLKQEAQTSVGAGADEGDGDGAQSEDRRGYRQSSAMQEL